MSTPTIAGLLPPKARQVVYALLIAANGGLVPAYAIYDLPPWVAIVVGAVNAAGFTLATSKVNA